MSAVVYRAFDAEDRLLYVGCTIDLEPRLRHHEDNSPWWPFQVRIETEGYVTRAEAAEAEAVAIATEHPRWNVKGRSPEHPDGPLNSRFNAPHLQFEVNAWREWQKVRALRAELSTREANLRRLMAVAAIAPTLADTA